MIIDSYNNVQFLDIRDLPTRSDPRTKKNAHPIIAIKISLTRFIKFKVIIYEANVANKTKREREKDTLLNLVFRRLR